MQTGGNLGGIAGVCNTEAVCMPSSWEFQNSTHAASDLIVIRVPSPSMAWNLSVQTGRPPARTTLIWPRMARQSGEPARQVRCI